MCWWRTLGSVVVAQLVLQAHAQGVDSWQLQARGLRLGVGARTFVGADAEKVTPQLGMSAGGFILLNLARLGGGELGLQLELLYSRHTVEQEILLGAGGYTLRYDLAYVEVPIVLRFAQQIAGILVAPHAGAVPAVRMSGRMEQLVGSSPPRKLGADFTAADISVFVGVGSEFALRRSARLFVDLRLQWGALSILRQAFVLPLREEKSLRTLHRGGLGLVLGVGF